MTHLLLLLLRRLRCPPSREAGDASRRLRLENLGTGLGPRWTCRHPPNQPAGAALDGLAASLRGERRRISLIAAIALASISRYAARRPSPHRIYIMARRTPPHVCSSVSTRYSSTSYLHHSATGTAGHPPQPWRLTSTALTRRMWKRCRPMRLRSPASNGPPRPTCASSTSTASFFVSARRPPVMMGEQGNLLAAARL